MNREAEEIVSRYRMFTKQFSETTSDFLFVGDIINKINWFYGDFSEYDTDIQDDQPISHETFLKLVDSRDRIKITEEIQEVALGHRDYHDMSYRWVKSNGNICWVNYRGKLIRDGKGHPVALVGRISENELAHLYNQMTGLWNKKRFLLDLKEVDLKGGFAMILFDIDNLTAINLTHGRDYGDEIIKETARIIEATEHVVAVYQIDQKNFIAITDSQDSQVLKEVFYDISLKQQEKCSYTAAGLCLDESMSSDCDYIFDTIYLTLGKAKQFNKNHLEIYSDGDVGARVRAHTLYEEMNESVHHDFNGFSLVYQPKVNRKTYTLAGVETLLRYSSPSLGQIMPSEFIPILERSQLMSDVGFWVLSKALAQYLSWKKYNIDFHISVNFSTVQFKDPFLPSKIMEMFQMYGVDPAVFTIEITESNPLHESRRYKDTLQTLRDYGLGISIDDFGTGYSNIGYLKRLNITELKIDRFFVKDVTFDSYNYHLINNLTLFAKENGIRICCEGVENTDELSILEGMDIDYIQGYLLDKPLDAKTFEDCYLNKDHALCQAMIEKTEKILDEVEFIKPLRFDYKTILRENKMGLWVARHTSVSELYLQGYALSKSPEDYHQFYERWKQHIEQEDLPQVCDFEKRLVQNTERQFVSFHWNHPRIGRLFVKCSGVQIKKSEHQTILCGVYVITEWE